MMNVTVSVMSDENLKYRDASSDMHHLSRQNYVTQ